MRIFDIKKPVINAICFIFVIIGIITCSYILTYDFSEVFESTVTDNYIEAVSFAVYVNTDDGYKEYSEVYGEELTNFSNLTSLKFTSSECRDYDNNVLSNVLTYNKGTIYVDTQYTTYCTLYFDIYELDCASEGLDLAECILRSENNFQSEEEAIEYIEEKGTPNFSSTSSTDEGLYVVEDDYGDSYYFRGTAEDNYVYFAGYYWRIVRINGDGSIRLIYDGTKKHENGDTSSDKGIEYVQYNYLDKPSKYAAASASYSNAYVGYMYGNNLFSDEKHSDTTTEVSLQKYVYFAQDCVVNEKNGRLVLQGEVGQYVWSESMEGWWTVLSPDITTNTTGYKKCYYITDYKDEYNASYDIYTVDDDGNRVKTGEGEATNMGNKITYFSTYDYDPQYGIYWFNEDSGGEIVEDFYFNNSSETIGYYTCGNNHTSCNELYKIDSLVNAAVVNAKVYSASSADYATTHENANSSKIKTAIDSWYKTNIVDEEDDDGNSYSTYISDTLFCADRELYSGDGVGAIATQYQPYYRLSTIVNPTLKCSQINDTFTVNDTTYGNGDLTYPVALITADEVVMAGGGVSSTSASVSSYLARSGSATMTPSEFEGTAARIWSITSLGNLSAGDVNSFSYASPVINLKGSVIVTDGDGTIDSPYTISLS